MGEVWKALDSQLQRYVAVKFLYTNLQVNPDFIAHFMREAQFIASLHHPNIVQVHDFQFVTEQDSEVKAYMVMDYIEGGTLADYIRHTSRRGLFPSAADIVYLLTGISLALDHAHQKGMIHRDIKLANILLDTSADAGQLMGSPILTDFGIARLQNADASTFTNAILDTPLYISPEQARNLPISERSDLYSLGIVLYELMTGITPFRGESPITIMMQHAYEMPTPPALINPAISSTLSAVVLQAISKDPMARFPSASALTIAVAHSLNVLVPTILNRPKYEQPGNNSLIPQSFSLLSDIASQHFAHPDASFPLPTPAQSGITDTQTASFTSTSSEKQASYIRSRQSEVARTPTTPTSLHNTQEQYHLQSVSSLFLQQSSAVTPVHPSRFGRKSLFIAITIGVLLLLVGISAFSIYPLLRSKDGTSANTISTPSSVVGRITFVSSQNASPNTYDQLQIDLNNIPPPSVGKVYYAWLENPNETIEYPHWEIQLSNETIHKLYSSNQQNTDLFTRSSLFLITEEAANSIPIVPMPDPSRMYYAIITHQLYSNPSFEVMPCPSSNTTNSGSPCM